MMQATPKDLRKHLKGTNVEIHKDAADGNDVSRQLQLLYAIHPDDENELRWFHATLRPERNLVHPCDSFLQGIKALRPAAVFNTFDVKKAKLRRLTKHEKDKLSALQRHKKEVVPTVAYKASVNPHKTPRTGGAAPVEEVRLLSRGKKKVAGAETDKSYFVRWKAKKAGKIGRGL